MGGELRLGIILLIGLIGNVTFAQSTYPINNNQDILHYTFRIAINDTTNKIAGEATLKFTLKNENKLTLDLIGLDDEGMGIVVEKIIASEGELSFTHARNRLIIDMPKKVNYLMPYEITIYYKGQAANGLIIDANKFGERVFFGDNYPDRARNWLPCVDHPSDKATVTWIVTAPNQYKVVASGKLICELKVANQFITTTWEEQVPISTKVMVFGAANFAIDNLGKISGIPVSTWVYKQNAKAGFYDFSVAPKVLAFFDSLIAPFPYEKLANVQSKTLYGGMENAGNIFYFEGAVNGKGERENLIAHEIVHQWFGNSVTESDWPHAWLSEGFATYLTHVYVGSQYGLGKKNAGLVADRVRVIKYWHKNPAAIVNYNLLTYPKVANLGELLSTNTYQKAGWVLHMLQNELGEDVFWQAVRKYYMVHKNSLASTADFQRHAEEVSGKDLQVFFRQWLYGIGQPNLAGSWQYKNGSIEIAVRQIQESPFVFPLELGLIYGDRVEVKKVNIGSTRQSFNFTLPKPDRIIFDPHTNLLFEGDSLLQEQE